MAKKDAKHATLIEYVGAAHQKEREIESSLAAQLVMTSRPAYHKRLEQHLKRTKIRAERLDEHMRTLRGSRGGPGRSEATAATRQAKDAAKTVTDRAVALAKGPVEEMGRDREAATLLANARSQLADAGEQVANYRIVRSLAKAAGDKPTGKLAREFRREHQDLGDFVVNVIPKLSKAVAKEDVKAKPSGSGGGRGSGAQASSSARRSSRSSSGSGPGSAGSSSRSSRSSGGGSRSTSGRAKSASGRSRQTSGSSRSTGGSSRQARGSRSSSGRGSSRSRSQASSSGRAGTRSASGSRGRSGGSRQAASRRSGASSTSRPSKAGGRKS